MDVREKLVEIMSDLGCNAEYCDDCKFCNDIDGCVRRQKEIIADRLIANGVTAQDGKPLEEFLHPIDAYKGLKAKYLVFKADTGKVVDNCFILRPDKDAAAVEALRAYANATDNKTLAEDIYSWVGNGDPVQEWISVKDRLPEQGQEVIVYSGGVLKPTVFAYQFWNKNYDSWARITHWMPLPQPPKGE